jgi:hypothetical protein
VELGVKEISCSCPHRVTYTVRVHALPPAVAHVARGANRKVHGVVGQTVGQIIR